MNKYMLERLSKNPHYKMSKEQKREFEIQNREPMIKFGEPEIEKNTFAKHKTNVVKIKYEKPKASKRIQTRSQ